MLRRRRGAIINVASLLAFSGPLRLPILPIEEMSKAVRRTDAISR